MRNKTTYRANGEQYVGGSPAWILMIGLAPRCDDDRQHTATPGARKLAARLAAENVAAGTARRKAVR